MDNSNKIPVSSKIYIPLWFHLKSRMDEGSDKPSATVDSHRLIVPTPTRTRPDWKSSTQKMVETTKIIALASLELEIVKVTWQFTWRSRTGSRMKVTVLIWIVLNSSTQKIVETTTKIISLAQLQPKLATVLFQGLALIFEDHRWEWGCWFWFQWILGHGIVGVKTFEILQWKLPKLWIYWGGGVKNDPRLPGK